MFELLFIAICLNIYVFFMAWYRGKKAKRCPKCTSIFAVKEEGRELEEISHFEEENRAGGMVFWSMQRNNPKNILVWRVKLKCNRCENHWEKHIKEIKDNKDRYRRYFKAAIGFILVIIFTGIVFKVALIMAANQK